MSVLTITPNASNVGDIVAVATVADPIQYNPNTATPWAVYSGSGTVSNVTATTIDTVDTSGSTTYILSDTLPVISGDFRFAFKMKIDGGDGNVQFFGLGSATTPNVRAGVVFSIDMRTVATGDTVDININSFYGSTQFITDATQDVYVTVDGTVGGTVTVTTTYGAVTNNFTFSVAGIDFSDLAFFSFNSFSKGQYISEFDGDQIQHYSLTQDAVEITSGTTTGGAISVDVTASLLLNGSLWQYFIDGVGSNIVTMLVSENVYYTPLTPFSCTLKLAMEIRKGYANTNSIFDWGSTADKYKTDATYISEGYTIWDRPTANVPETNLNLNGFYPFGNLFASNVAGYRYPVYQGKANFHGDFHSWDVELIPDSSAGYTYDTSPWVARNVTGFSFGSLVNFPFPNCTPEAEYSISYNRIGNVVREYDSGEASEHRPFSMQWNNLCGEDLRGILIQIITVNRGFSFPISAGSSLARLGAWLPREGESLSGVFNVRLVSPLIEYTCTDADLWDLEIKVMKWES